MSESIISKKIEQLSPGAKKQAQDFVDFLYQHYVGGKKKDKDEPSSISDSSFFGIWKNREEMKDSTQWVRDLRKSQWANK